jgi:hypothetical protein
MKTEQEVKERLKMCQMRSDTFGNNLIDEAFVAALKWVLE